MYRRMHLIWINILIIISSCLMTIQNYYVLIFCRIMRGVASGAISVVVPVFMNEITNSHLKGPVLSFIHIFMTFGSLNVYIFAINTPLILNTKVESIEDYCATVKNEHIAWRELFLLPIIPALVQLFLLLFVFTKDSTSLSKLFIKITLF